MAGNTGIIAGDGVDPRLGEKADVIGQPDIRQPSAMKLYDPKITFEEYYYYAQLSRNHPSEAPDATSKASTPLTLKNNPFKRRTTSTHDSFDVNEKGSDSSNAVQHWHNVSEEDYVQASRALRTAAWGSVFFLIITDILGPFSTA